MYTQAQVDAMLNAAKQPGNQAEIADSMKKLTAAVSTLDLVARTRQLTAKERGDKAEFEGALEALRGQLVDGPLTLQSFGGSGTREAGPFKTPGEQFLAIARAARPGSPVDERLYQVRAAAGLSETVPSDGGFLLQQDFSNAFLTNAFDSGQIAKLCTRISISGNSNGIKLNAYDETTRATGSRLGGVQGYWLAESAEKQKSKPKFRQMELSLKKLIGLCYTSDELLADAAVLNTVIPQAFTAELSFLLDDAIINGTGAGQPLGILNAGCLVSVGAEQGQKAATIVAENVFKMHSRLLASGDANSVWLINRTTLPQLYQMSLAVGTGGAPVFLPAGSVAGVPLSTLLGRPIVVVEQCQAVGTLGDIILADLKGGYVLADKGGIQQDMSIHVNFIYDESVFRFVFRCDGQPVLASAITPYKGGAGATQSHFVALATRTA